MFEHTLVLYGTKMKRKTQMFRMRHESDSICVQTNTCHTHRMRRFIAITKFNNNISELFSGGAAFVGSKTTTFIHSGHGE